MKKSLSALALLSALVAAPGCAQLTGALAAAAIPSAAPSAGASAAPATAASTAPVSTASTAPAATPTKAPASTAPATPVADEASDCKAEKSDADKDNGTAAQGGYNNQWLPKGWVAAYKSEQAVTDAIGNLPAVDWPCFQKFYPGATTIYKKRMGIS